MSIERVERKSGIVWRMRWRDAAGRAHSKVVGRKRDAEAFEAEIMRRKRTGEIDLFGAGKQTLAEFAEEWWRLYAVPNLAMRTRRSYAALWDRHVLGRLGALRLHEITPVAIEQYRSELEAAGIGQPTIYRALALLQGVLQRAVEWQRIAQNPVKLVRKPQVRRLRDVRPLSPATVEELRAAAGTAPVQGDRNATLISVLAYAGLRPQEALALTWRDVRDRTLLIDKRLTARAASSRPRPANRGPSGWWARSPRTCCAGGSSQVARRTTRWSSRARVAASGTTRTGRRGMATSGSAPARRWA